MSAPGSNELPEDVMYECYGSLLEEHPRERTLGWRIGDNLDEVPAAELKSGIFSIEAITHDDDGDTFLRVRALGQERAQQVWKWVAPSLLTLSKEWFK